MHRILFIVILIAMTSSCSKKNPPPQQPPPPTDTQPPGNPNPPDPPDPPDPPTDTTKKLTSHVLAEGLNFPWEITWGPDNRLWMTERTGKISVVDTSTGAITPILTISDVDSRNEGGLLGMALHPEFNTTPQVFVAYNYNKAGTYSQKVVRYNFDGTTLTSPVVLVDNLEAANIHNGSRLLIASDKLFITTGDASDLLNPQDLSSRNGKILRINLDGCIPADNPIPSSPIWSIGHRNPQGLVFVKDSLFASEHGPDTDDEINIIHRGANYGWPDVVGTCNDTKEETTFCNTYTVTEPLMKWTPTIAVCGLDYYTQTLIPGWNNSLLMCTLKASKLVQLQLNAAGNQITGSTDFFADDFGRLRDLCISPDGKVFLCTSNGGGNDKIIEVTME